MHWLERLNALTGHLDVGGAGVEVLHWAYAEHLRDNVPHRHTYFEVCLVGKYGRGEFIVQEQPHRVKSHDLFIARPGVLHQITNTAQPQMELYWVSFSAKPRGDAQSEAHALVRAFAHSRELVVRDEGRITALWQALRAVAEGDDKAGLRLQIQNIMTALLLAIAQAGAGNVPAGVSTSSPPGDELARWALRYIHDNLDRRLGIEEIADHVHISRRHLTRLVTGFTGVSPATYIERARMDRARALLLDSALPIKSIAAEVGYRDAQHFTRVFTRLHQVSPVAFRKARSTPPADYPPGALV